MYIWEPTNEFIKIGVQVVCFIVKNWSTPSADNIKETKLTKRLRVPTHPVLIADDDGGKCGLVQVLTHGLDGGDGGGRHKLLNTNHEHDREEY